MSLVRATPFHARTAATNRLNRWQAREGWTLAASYSDPHAEALAARLSCAVADISWRWHVMVEGPRAEEFLSRLVTRDPSKLSPGAAFKALWLNDAGGLRGAGVIARHGKQTFALIAAASDMDWIARAASLFDVCVRHIADGGLAIIGPYARKVIAASGLDATLEPLCFRKIFWRGLDVTLSRFGEQGGYELWCKDDDATIVWDRIVKAGEAFALKPAGLDAMDILDLEAGVPRPGRDYEPARDGFSPSPSPYEFGLESLIDSDHAIFNGRKAFLLSSKTKTRVGIEFDVETPAPHAPLTREGRIVGHTLSSLYSPALRRAIALAVVENAVAGPGTELAANGGTARVCASPFLPLPDSILE